jgi:enoyl-[acyl-carrier protein] reductase II
MAMQSRITELFEIDYPIISGGMVWCSGWELAAAVSNAGGLGLIGAGSMTPEVLREHIIKCREKTPYNFGVNVPLMRPQAAELMEVIAEQKVPIVFTSAGSPKKWTGWLHEHKIKVAHVVSSSAFAVKCEAAGVDAIVAEGFEAGGHNGKEETTTMCLIPQVRKATTLPLIAAGGIASGEACLAAQILGAEGVQIGTLFALSEESSAHENFKKACTNLEEGDTMLCLKKLAPSRLVKNGLYNQLAEAEAKGADVSELLEILGEKATRRGIFDGDTEGGEMEIGQIASAIKTIEPVSVIMARLVEEYNEAVAKIRKS